MKKQERQLTVKERLEREYRQKKADEKMVADAMLEAQTFTNHHITGAIYTAIAIILRRPPYRWGAEKVMRFLGAVGGVINSLNNDEITMTDLVTEGEKYGIRVLWNAGHRFIENLSVFEEHEDGTDQ